MPDVDRRESSELIKALTIGETSAASRSFEFEVNVSDDPVLVLMLVCQFWRRAMDDRPQQVVSMWRVIERLLRAHIEIQAKFAVRTYDTGVVSYKVGVTTRSDSNLVFNGLRFAQGASAHDYGESLKRRWSEVVSFVVESSMDPANCHFPVPSDRYAVRKRPPILISLDGTTRLANPPVLSK